MYCDATILSFDEWKARIKKKLEDNIKLYNQDRHNKKRKREKEKEIEIEIEKHSLKKI